MNLAKQEAQKLCYELFGVNETTEDWDFFEPNLKLVSEELVDTSRWSNIYERIYQNLDDNTFWKTTYSVGATECQDESPYEYDGDEIEFTQVFPKEVVIVTYVEEGEL